MRERINRAEGETKPKAKKNDKEDRRTGHWFTVEHEYASCSECGGDIFTDWPTTKEAKEKVKTFHEKYRYCPFCGASMEPPHQSARK